VTVDRYFGLYHETFRIRGNRETFFSHRDDQGPLDRLTRFSALGENAAHGQRHSIKTEPDSALGRPPRSPLHLVPGADEEASRRRQSVCPLHLPEMRIPTHNQARTKTTQPRALESLPVSRPVSGSPAPHRPLASNHMPTMRFCSKRTRRSPHRARSLSVPILKQVGPWAQRHLPAHQPTRRTWMHTS
jgi:hypothetical protein